MKRRGLTLRIGEFSRDGGSRGQKDNQQLDTQPGQACDCPLIG